MRSSNFKGRRKELLPRGTNFFRFTPNLDHARAAFSVLLFVPQARLQKVTYKPGYCLLALPCRLPGEGGEQRRGRVGCV